ncbi:hypothetical protein QCA50_019509 [Cerrena zonata]|uniref:C3H1-type domain-containing protein n=1 Tax=Cerrena zonata TaxID=2478898 RepID=A0AAW0FAG8_9APHY
MSDSRYIHRTNLKPHTPAYVQGQQQTEIAMERFHYLCAAANKQYILLDNISPDLGRAQLFPRQGLDFSQYHIFALKSITGIKLHPRGDGTIHPGDIEVYVDTYRRNWKSREGGILYFVADAREFWNMVLNYHSSSHTTGIQEWDILLDKLKVETNPKLVPCMFFARQAGCLNATCPFLHDKLACQRERALVLEARRIVLGQPTTRDISQRYEQGLAELRSSRSDTLVSRDLDDLSHDPEMQRLWKERRIIKKICSNPQCLTVKWKTSAHVSANDEPQPVLKACSRCKVTFYCSVCFILSLLFVMRWYELGV